MNETSAGYTLYGSRGSGSAAVEAALEIARVRYRIITASTWEPKSARAALKQANPLGQIPTLVCTDGTVLSESAAILIHLALAHPRAKLLPADPAQRAQAIRALVYIAANCYAAIGVVDYPSRWLGNRADKDDLERLRLGARKRLHQLWRVFADQVGNGSGTYLFGDQLGAADLLAAVVSKWSGARTHLGKHRPGFSALLHRIEAHPIVTAVFERHWPASA